MQGWLPAKALNSTCLAPIGRSLLLTWAALMVSMLSRAMQTHSLQGSLVPALSQRLDLHSSKCLPESLVISSAPLSSSHSFFSFPTLSYTLSRSNSKPGFQKKSKPRQSYFRPLRGSTSGPCVALLPVLLWLTLTERLEDGQELRAQGPSVALSA